MELFVLLQVSPSDGKILHLGIVQHDRVEQIKGITYSLHDFLGKGNWPTRWGMPAPDRADEQHRDSVQCNPDTSLYHCVIYLAPGNYHGFHSPADWTATLRRHFPGGCCNWKNVMQSVCTEILTDLFVD